MGHRHFDGMILTEDISKRNFIATSTAIALAAGAAAIGGATAYSANREASAAKKAAEAQKQVGLAQIEAPIKAEQAAAEAAKAQLKLRQGSKSRTILTAPADLTPADTNKPTLLGA